MPLLPFSHGHATESNQVSVHMTAIIARGSMYCISVQDGIGSLAARCFRCFRYDVAALE